MRTAALAFVVAILTAGACARAGDGDGGAGRGAAAAKAQPGTIDAGQLATLVAVGGCTVVDANTPTTRRDLGVIPGARLLTSYDGYGLDELAADKDQKLVFYCANEACGASHEAAEKALLAGYRDVNVFPGGIVGWKRSGNAVAVVP